MLRTLIALPINPLGSCSRQKIQSYSKAILSILSGQLCQLLPWVLWLLFRALGVGRALPLPLVLNTEIPLFPLCLHLSPPINLGNSLCCGCRQRNLLPSVSRGQNSSFNLGHWKRGTQPRQWLRKGGGKEYFYSLSGILHQGKVLQALKQEAQSGFIILYCMISWFHAVIAEVLFILYSKIITGFVVPIIHPDSMSACVQKKMQFSKFYILHECSLHLFFLYKHSD